MTHRIHHLVVPLAGLLAAGCLVPAEQYEEAKTAADAAQDAHRETARRLFEAEQRISKLEADAAQEREAAKQRLAASERQLAQVQLDHDVVLKERDSATQLVDQLRGELGRVGGHLRVYSDQKQRLEAQLRDAELRAAELGELEKSSARRVILVRDLTLTVNPLLASGHARLAVVDNQPRLRIAASELFSGGSLKVGAKQLLQAIGKASAQPAPAVRVSVTERGTETDDALLVRLAKIAEVLSEGGISSELVTVSIPEAENLGEPVAKQPEVELIFDVGGKEASPSK